MFVLVVVATEQLIDLHGAAQKRVDQLLLIAVHAPLLDSNFFVVLVDHLSKSLGHGHLLSTSFFTVIHGPRELANEVKRAGLLLLGRFLSDALQLLSMTKQQSSLGIWSQTSKVCSRWEKSKAADARLGSKKQQRKFGACMKLSRPGSSAATAATPRRPTLHWNRFPQFYLVPVER